MSSLRLLSSLSAIAVAAAITWVSVTANPLQAQDWPPVIERRLPPPGIEVPAEQLAAWHTKLEDFAGRAKALEAHELFADVAVLARAVQYAIDHGEFYAEKEFAAADKTLDMALRRLADLEAGKTPWAEDSGLLVRGYRSKIDDSLQPFGLHIPEELDRGRPAPLLIWLHGRGDKTTDLHFIQRCLAKNSALGGYFDAPNVITVHPFGRQCVGWKHAGEIDVFEVLAEVRKHYNIDPDRVALAGFSMGGAGAWHIGAHYADEFCAVHAGAGFAETAVYNNLQPEQYPPDLEQKLWGLYDVPNYVRNLFNVPTLAYSGEEDKQKQAADLMAVTFAAHGRELPHLIGPGMGHKYHPETAKEVQDFLLDAMHRGREPLAARVTLQTQTLRYSKVKWLQVTELTEHWQDSRVDAALIDDGLLELETKNVDQLSIERPMEEGAKILIDGQEVDWKGKILRRDGRGWMSVPGIADKGLKKRPGLQGPIDDAFMAPFLVVLPSGESKHPDVQRWVEFESQHFQERWKALMRGEVRVKQDAEVTPEDVLNFHLILWGDATSNSLIGELMPDLPLVWTGDKLQVGGGQFDGRVNVPAMIYPNPRNRDKYVVLNSGLTFREDHDRTNSLQNPKLGDWAVIGLEQAPDGEHAGWITAGGFFDEGWAVPRQRVNRDAVDKKLGEDPENGFAPPLRKTLPEERPGGR